MQKDDDDERTVFTPTPGGGRRRGGAAAKPPADDIFATPPAPPAASPIFPQAGGEPTSMPGGPLPEGIGANPLLNAAASMFALVRQLRGVRSHGDVAGLRRDVIEAIKQFDADARRAGIEAKTTAQAAYALCALVDETVLSTPWGFESIWAKQSLLITFYKEYTAGEAFFNFLKKAKESPKQYLDLLEFFYVCLSLGFQGRFRHETGGVDQLSRTRQELYNVIRRERVAPPPELSPHWRGVTDKGPRVSRFVPLWVVGVAGLAIVIAAFIGFSYSLNAKSDVVFTRIAQLVQPGSRPAPQPLPPALAAPAPTKTAGVVARLKATLAPEIAQRLVDVQDQGDAARIIIFNRGMFPSGSAEVGATFRDLIRKIAVFLAEQQGPFQVTGHSDNVPIRTLRFPSNWHLSKARAEAVAAILAETVSQPGALKVEGRADAEPLASNDTAEGRALNRRVEVRMPVR